jgi:hypothetical protein
MSEIDVGPLMDWLAERVGKRLYVEIGVKDPNAPHHGDVFVAKLHTTLAEVGPATDELGMRGDGIALTFEDREDRVFITPAMLSDLQVKKPYGVKATMFDGSLYITLT